jgi:hypothetical protein
MLEHMDHYLDDQTNRFLLTEITEIGRAACEGVRKLIATHGSRSSRVPEGIADAVTF